ncbi:hypothetical protein VUR80DRAFT_2514 [Thermomyces stellatus]
MTPSQPSDLEAKRPRDVSDKGEDRFPPNLPGEVSWEVDSIAISRKLVERAVVRSGGSYRVNRAVSISQGFSRGNSLAYSKAAPWVGQRRKGDSAEFEGRRRPDSGSYVCARFPPLRRTGNSKSGKANLRFQGKDAGEAEKLRDSRWKEKQGGKEGRKTCAPKRKAGTGSVRRPGQKTDRGAFCGEPGRPGFNASMWGNEVVDEFRRCLSTRL